MHAWSAWKNAQLAVYLAMCNLCAVNASNCCHPCLTFLHKFAIAMKSQLVQNPLTQFML